MGSSAALRELQRDLEAKANDLNKLQKGKHRKESPDQKEVYHTTRRERARPQGELDLLNEDANVYKLIGPVLVKQDLAEANANVRKRIDYISAELYVCCCLDALVGLISVNSLKVYAFSALIRFNWKRLDATLQDLEDKQNSKKDTVSTYSPNCFELATPGSKLS
ncbi:hypothetical protein RJ639_036757 [Escallonia herrerae]|uniref:Prefoldin subunit 6 n=1 Tax=Escallonia herrerae TaxID=1293975 RepID=A0AA88WX15_9ASTE|nr:hypothetical protein RJ639_025114 [Escallonia herrerae]KAK3032693.1 hypothetical protein RJ639_036757 [Escallonia herrerae]